MRVVPFATAPNYVDAIEQICDRYHIDMILPGSDEEVFALSPHRDRLEANGKRYLACAPDAVLSKIKDKISTYNALASLDLPVPEWQEVTSIEALLPALKRMREEHGDFVIKPSQSRGGRDVFVIRSDIPDQQVKKMERELHLNYKTFLETFSNYRFNNFPLLISQRLIDPIYDIDMLGWKGEAINVVSRRRHNPSRPNQGHLIVNNPELLQLGKDLITKLGISSLLDCDIMYGQDGKPYILEINPRPSGSSIFSITAGVPLLDNLITLAKGELVPENTVLNEKSVVAYTSLKILNE